MADSVFKLKADGNPVYLKITSAIFKRFVGSSTQLDAVDAVNLRTGESCCVAVDTVLKNVLREAYPDNGYAGRSFQIEKFAPVAGKSYATFDVKEVRLRKDDPRDALDELRAALSNRNDRPADGGSLPAIITASGENGGLDRVQTADYAEYLKSPLWRKIKRRVLKRDGKACRRCGGKATRVHHRSYTDEVLAGNDDEQLASICEGCHNFIHFDDNGYKRNPEETDRFLMTPDESKAFPVPQVDLRLRWRKDPPGWDRMSAVQRQAWHGEYVRLQWLHWLRLGKSPETCRYQLKTHHGMTDEQIDSEVAALRKHKGQRRNRTARMN
jgi:hypothetical protein